MHVNHAPGPNREQRLDEVLAAYLKAVEDGGAPDRQECRARHPELAPELAAFFADQDRFERLAAPLRVPRPKEGGATESPLHTAPRSFGVYELLEELGCSGMAVVYRARQQSPSRLVALKMIRAGRLASAADVRRFRNE